MDKGCTYCKYHKLIQDSQGKFHIICICHESDKNISEVGIFDKCRHWIKSEFCNYEA